VKFKLDENLPASSAAILAGAGHDVDTVGEEGLGGATDHEVVAAYPPGSHAGIVVLRLTDQSAAAVGKAVSDPAALTDADGLAGAVSVLQRGLLRIRHP
jgi:uncharacterized protein YjlB